MALPLLFLATGSQEPSQTIWIEGENPASANVKFNSAGWGRKELLSGEKWLQISVDADKVEKELPAGGALLAYKFQSGAGKHEIWDRIGYEFVRSAFEWRLDGGEWTRVEPDELTTDLQELETWNEVAWLKLGERELTAGEHTLEIRVPLTKDDKGKAQRAIYASDAIVVSPTPFRPNSRFKPGETWRKPEDEKAAEQVFLLPEGGGAARQLLPLEGLWEVARDDEQLPGPVAEPIKALPRTPYWSAIPVPSDRNVSRPDLVFAHRLWYRTKVHVPASQAGRSFHLTFPHNNLNTTVYVNGTFCGFEKNPLVKFDIDVTKGIKPGINEIWVGIRDPWYGYSASPTNPLKLRKKFNLPLAAIQRGGFQDLAYPVWGAMHSGILETPVLTVAGAVKAADVFVKPSVAKKRLDAEVTLHNTTEQPANIEVGIAAVDPQSTRVVKAIARQTATLAPNQRQVLDMGGAWENPELWWPDSPRMYHLRTTVTVNGTPVDISEVPFGFREWGNRGKDFTLNGIVWHGWADLIGEAKSKEDWLAKYRNSNQRFMRLSGDAQNGGYRWRGMSFGDSLDWFDRNGVVVRRSNVLDGEMIGYMAIETDDELKKLYGSEIKKELMNNWVDQLAAQVRAERNHPSIHLWSIENEWLYINCINLYGGLMDEFEREVARAGAAVEKADPTRLWMVDGGGAGKDQLFPVHGDHYVFSPNDGRYPDLAYQAYETGGGRGRWVWDQKRPRYLAEDFYASGVNPADYAWIGGETTFQGKAQSHEAIARVQRMLTEGYRWAGLYGAWHFWVGDEGERFGKYTAFSPLAVFTRQYDWSFGSGQAVKRTFGIFNDTRDARPVEFTWTLNVGGKTVATKTTTHPVEPGSNQKFDALIEMPRVSQRAEGEMVLELKRDGQVEFRDVKAVSVLPAISLPKPRPASQTRKAPAPPTGGGVAVYDPKGSVVPFLKASGIAHKPLNSLAAIPTGTRVLLIGSDALDESTSTSSALAAFASAGNRVIVLDQKHPLRYQALPAEVAAQENSGKFAFAEDLTHPALRGLKQKDFFTWSGDGTVYRNAYRKPERGAKSLIQCDGRLGSSALMEVPVGGGLMLLSQLSIGDKIGSSPVAQRLVANMLRYAEEYRLEFRPVAASVAAGSEFAKALDGIGLKYDRAKGPLEALNAKIAIVEATPANLKVLATNKAKVDAFNKAGGSLVLHGLTPEGLADYNRIVGFDHMIRPFRRERVTWPTVRHPLTSGMTLGDVVLYSSERLFDWTDDRFVASDTFSYVVDYDDVAPFAQLPSDYHYNAVNGMVSADGWKYIFSFELNSTKPEMLMRLPKEQELTGVEWTGNGFYHLTTKIELDANGQKTALTTEPNIEPQRFDLAAPIKAKDVTLRITDWQKVPTAGSNVVGIDNLRLFARRPPEFLQRVKPLVNVGGLMLYERGAGNILLANLLFKPTEEVPLNATKKRTILATLLRNLKAPFASGKTVIVGAPLDYAPVDLAKQANAYRNERGWFGDANFTFRDLPTGRQTFGGVPFNVYEFPTSPVPTAVVLGGPGVPGNLAERVEGIPVNQKADALFFLQTARVDQRRNDQERREGKAFEMARYVVKYADGQSVNVPIRPEIDVDDFRQKSPTILPGAQIGWTRPYAGTEFTAVAYVKQWNNPRPDAAIASVTLEYGPDRRGVPALLAITAARTK